MDNQQHTPGPWKVEHTFGEMIIRDSEDYPIAVIHGEDAIEESKYNAELIARAPELLQENERQSEQIKKLEGLLNDVLADVQYADHKIDKDLRNEIKAALNL